MSRIGKKQIDIPDGVKVSKTDNKLSFNGPKGKFELKLHPKINVQIDEPNKKIKVLCEPETANDKAVYGTFRSLINNAVIGVATGYEKKIEIHGVGYNAKLQGQELSITIGYSHPVKVNVPAGIVVTIPNPNMIVMQSVDKELIGHFADSVRAIKPCEPYNLKGIKYADEVIKRKAGKTFVSGSA